MNKPPTEREIKDFLAKNGRRGQLIIGMMQDHLPLINELIKTDFGWEMVKEEVATCQANIWKSIMSVNPEEREEARLTAKNLLQLTESKLTKIDGYIKHLAEIKGETHGKEM